MGIDVGLVTAPASWAGYLINGDCSDLSDAEVRACDRWLAGIAPAYVVDIERDDEGTPYEARFTYSYAMYGGTAEGGEVLDYVTHQPAEAGEQESQ